MMTTMIAIKIRDLPGAMLFFMMHENDPINY